MSRRTLLSVGSSFALMLGVHAARANPPIPFSPQLMAEAPENENYYPRDQSTLTLDNSTSANGISAIRPEPVFGSTGDSVTLTASGTAEATYVAPAPGVADGVAITASTNMTAGGNSNDRYYRHGFYALATFDCTAGQTSGQNIILAVDGSDQGIQSRQPALVVNNSATNLTSQPGCTLDVQMRNPTGYNDVSAQLAPGLHTHRILYHQDDVGVPHLWVDSGPVINGAGVAIAPYGSHVYNASQNTQLGVPGDTQPATLTAWGFFADNDAEFTPEEPMLDWWLAQAEASFDPTDAVLPSTHPYFNTTPMVQPQNTLLATSHVPTQIADYHTSADAYRYGSNGVNDAIQGVGGAALGTPQPDVSTWNLTFQNSFTNGVANDVLMDFKDGPQPSSANGYLGPLYDSTQAINPQTNVLLVNLQPPFNYQATSLDISQNCAEPGTDMGDGVTNYLRMTIGPYNAAQWQACSIATVNTIGYGFSQKWGAWEVKFRIGYANCSNVGNTCPGILNVHQCALWGYLVEGFLKHHHRPRMEVDGPEVYNGSLTNNSSGLSLTQLYHGTYNTYPGWGFGVGGPAQNTSWRTNTGNPGNAASKYWCDPTNIAQGCISTDPANVGGEDYFGVGGQQTNVTIGQWHTVRIYFDPVANRICHAFDGLETACTPMPREFHFSPFMAISGLFPGGNIVDTGHTYYYDVAWMKAWQNPAWANIP